MSVEGAWMPCFKVLSGNEVNGVLVGWAGTLRLIQAL